MLGISKNRFKSSIEDAHNWFSYLLVNENVKPDKIDDGEKIFYILLIIYMIRLAIFDKINSIKIDNDIVDDYYNTIYDWYALEILKNGESFKTNTYKIRGCGYFLGLGKETV